MYDKGLLPLGGLRPQPYQSQGGYENVHDATDSGEWWQQQNPGGGGSGPFAYVSRRKIFLRQLETKLALNRDERDGDIIQILEKLQPLIMMNGKLSQVEPRGSEFKSR